MNQISSKFKTLPEWLQSILKSASKFVGFIALWVLIANALILFNPPIEREPNDRFFICVIEDNKPSIVVINKRNNLPLCQQPIKNTNLGSAFYSELDKINTANENTEEWQLTTWGDRIGDPFVYRYQVKDDKVEPLKWWNGGVSIILNCWLMGLIFSIILWKVGKRIVKKRTESIRKWT